MRQRQVLVASAARRLTHATHFGPGHLYGRLTDRLQVTAAKAFLRGRGLHYVAYRAVAHRHDRHCGLSITDTLVDALEAIAHFAPGRAGVIATEALIAAGVWSQTVETQPREHPIAHWLTTGFARIPVHDDPHPDGLIEALCQGTRMIVAPR